MTDDDMSSEVHTDYIELPTASSDDLDRIEPQDTLAYDIASYVMEEFNPGFVIVGSPNSFVTKDGIRYPEAIGIVVKEKAFTKTDVAAALEMTVYNMRGDVTRVEEFLKEAMNKDD